MLLGNACLLVFGVMGFWLDSEIVNIDLESHMPNIIKNIFEDQGNSEIEAKLIAKFYLSKQEGFNFKNLKSAIMTDDLFKLAEEWRKELFYDIFPIESKDLIRKINYLPFSYKYYQAIKTSFDTYNSKKPIDKEYKSIEIFQAESSECPLLMHFSYTF